MRYCLPLIVVLALPLSLLGQNRIGTGRVMELYQQHCAVCHGSQMEGGLGGPLVSKQWRWAERSDADLARVIQDGIPEVNMPPYKEVLSKEEIRSLVVLINEFDRKVNLDTSTILPVSDGNTVATRLHTYRVEPVVDGLETPWAFAFLPDGSMLITERSGRLRQFYNGVLLPPIEGTPEVWAIGQGGLLDVALHPDFEQNGWIYLAYTASSGGEADRSVGSTAIVRGRIEANRWVDEEVIFQVPEAFHTRRGVHFGTRLVFDDGYLFFSIGDRGIPDTAQDPISPNGKVHRIYDDGRVPLDNPFAVVANAFPTIWTLGNRNQQGMDFHPVTGELWAAEHGPRGGDELNRIEPGLNYGWPVITHGIHYNGTPISDLTEMDGMEPPALHWTPSIAVCGIAFYRGDAFPEWKNDLLVGGLASQQLHRVRIENGKVIDDEIILAGIGRIRAVGNGPDGTIYLALNQPDVIVRLVPLASP